LLTYKQTNKQTKSGKNTTSLAEVTTIIGLFAQNEFKNTFSFWILLSDCILISLTSVIFNIWKLL